MDKNPTAVPKRNLQRLRAGERGQGLVEYTMLLAVVSFVAIAAVTSLGETIVTRLYTLAGSF